MSNFLPKLSIFETHILPQCGEFRLSQLVPCLQQYIIHFLGRHHKIRIQFNCIRFFKTWIWDLFFLRTLLSCLVGNHNVPLLIYTWTVVIFLLLSIKKSYFSRLHNAEFCAWYAGGSAPPHVWWWMITMSEIEVPLSAVGCLMSKELVLKGFIMHSN